MMNAARVERKSPSLLIDGNTTVPEHWKAHNKIACRIQRLRIHNRGKHDSLNAKLIMVLEE